MGGEFEGEWIHICMAEPFHCSPETTTTLLIGHTLIQIKSLKFENKYRKKKKKTKNTGSGLPFPTSEDLPTPEIEPMSFGSPALSGRCFATVPPGKSPAHNVVIVSGGQQRDSSIYVHVSILPQTPLPSRVPHNIE